MLASRSLAAAALCTLVLCTGCVLAQTTDGTKIRDTDVEGIVVGQSTRADVVRMLGAPDKIIYSNLEHDPLFERAYRFRRTKRRTTFFTIIIFSAARTDKNEDNVIVFFDDDGVVEDVAVRLDMNEPGYGKPWGGD